MSESEVQKLWQQHWHDKSTIEETGSFYGKLLHQKRLIILKNILKKLDRASTVLDMGCGGGSTMTTFKESGFNNITGIDFTEESILRCEKRGFIYGRDVFQADAKHTSFLDEQFDIVFSEGLWEHFLDPRPHIAEAARLAKTYIIVIQPDHFSFFGYLMHLGWNLFNKDKGGVREYSYPLSYFEQFLKLYNFDLILSKSTMFHEQTIMVFKKQIPWQISQQCEVQYVKNTESKTWQIPYSAEYWKKLLNLESLDGQGIEIGCGTNGIYNFAPNIIGLDSINFHHRNFIQATGEHLPFQHLDFAILCNSLDHCQNPKQVLKEVSKTTSHLYLWTYTHPKIVSYLLSKFDKMHPYHFTKKDIAILLKNLKTLHKTSCSPLNFSQYTNSKKTKIKLLVMYLLNIRGNCIHLQSDKNV